MDERLSKKVGYRSEEHSSFCTGNDTVLPLPANYTLLGDGEMCVGSQKPLHTWHVKKELGNQGLSLHGCKTNERLVYKMNRGG